MRSDLIISIFLLLVFGALAFDLFTYWPILIAHP
jgi:hypothetical protein